ncbi:hypothetical protein KCU95_g5726, partial [Aureobasidium melanogenum]
MTRLEIPFDEEDVSQWTYLSVRSHVESAKKKLKAFYLNFFGWPEEEYQEAKGHTSGEILKYFDRSKKFPTTGREARLRHTVQTNLVRDWPDLFVNRHGPNPPAWFDTELVSRPPTNTEIYNSKNVVQQFIALTRHSSHITRQYQSKRKRYADEDDDDKNDDDNPNNDDDANGNRLRNKQPRTSWRDRTTSFPTITSLSVAPRQPTTSVDSRVGGNRLAHGSCSYSSGQDNSSTSAAAEQASNTGVKTMVRLVLYITRVTIVNQSLHLERDRFALVDNLFENDHLVEPRLHELVFGNPMDNKPTFLWFFDDTSDDEPRSIRNRPSAETAIVMLRAWAERLGASGIQIFDALDYDTAALVPAHEVTRRDKFVQRASFELELEDNGDLDDDNDDNEDDGGAERGFEAAAADRSRDLDLQCEDEAIQGAPDSEPNKQQYQQQVKMENESESEEE